MNVFMITGDIDFGYIHAGYRDSVHDRFRAANHLPSSEGWVAPLLEPQLFRKKLYTIWVDCLASSLPNGNDMLLNVRARAALGSWLEQSGELLPVRFDGQDYCWFNCLVNLDGLVNNSETQGERYSYGDYKGWQHVTRWFFIEEMLASAPAIFRVPEGNSRLFCTDVLADAIRSSDLIGFDIKKVWTSNPEDTAEPVVTFTDQFELPNDFARRDEIKAKRKAALAALKARETA